MLRNDVIADCVECGSRAVVIAGLTRDAHVLCSECESPRGIYAEFFDKIRAALGDSSGRSVNNDNNQQYGPDWPA